MSTPKTVKTQIESLIASANATTGKADTDLTSAVGSLVEGFGQGGSGEDFWRMYDGLTDYASRFKGITTLTDMPYIDTSNGTNFTHTFNGCSKMENIARLDYSSATKMQGTYASCPLLKYVPYINSSKATTFNDCFFNCSSLEEVEGIDLSNATTMHTFMHGNLPKLNKIGGTLNISNLTHDIVYTIFNCPALEEIAFENGCIKRNFSIRNCPKLIDASIQSIIDGLADLTGQDAQTLTFHADVKAKLTETQIATITSKNWTLA